MEEILDGLSYMSHFNIKKIKSLIKTVSKQELHQQIASMVGEFFSYKYFEYETKENKTKIYTFILNVASALDELGIGVDPLMMYQYVDSGIVKKTYSIIFPRNSPDALQFIQRTLEAYRLMLGKVMTKYYKDIYLLFTKKVPLEIVSKVSTYVHDKPFGFKKKSKRKSRKSSRKKSK